MLKTLSILVFSLYFIIPCRAQEILQLKNFADEQFARGNYMSALKEYQRLLFFDKRNEFGNTYSKIANLFFINNDFENAVKYYDYAFRAEDNDSLKFEFVLKKSLCNFKTGNFFAALNELYDLPETHSVILLKKKNIYLGTCYFGLDDYEKAQSSFSESMDSIQTNQLAQIFADLKKIRKKYNPGKVELMSMLLPGLGQIYTGHTGSGLNSFFLLSTVSFYALKTTATYGALDGLLIMSSWFYRYYTGGYNNAHHFAEDKIENEKEKCYNRILNLNDRPVKSVSE